MSAPNPEPETGDGPDRASAVAATSQPEAWLRLHRRVIWVDLAQSLVSLVPAVAGVLVFGVNPGAGTMWPLVAAGAFGVIGAVADALRWAFTRYRITEGYVELRTGVLVRNHRSIRRDRIRSVDIEGRLRYRLAGLRVVKIGAGQQSAAGESALQLDAVRTADAETLRHLLLRLPAVAVAEGAERADVDPADAVADPKTTGRIEVFARFRAGWVVYNMFNIWAFAIALGLGWGAVALLSAVGIDAGGFIAELLDWEAIGWGWTAAIGVLAVGAFGVVGLGVNYIIEYWNFELARVPGQDGTLLRTSHGLLTTREVNREDKRMRGIQISEPVLWRWLGVTDTTVVTTGLSLWSMSQPAAILPRGPIGAARRVAGDVLGGARPLDARLVPHPRAALRRRLWWAGAFTSAVAAAAFWLWATGVLPVEAAWSATAVVTLSFPAAVVAYRALGHAISGPYLVVRSGLLSRATTALRRSAVSTVAIRESVLQRRLGLKTVSAMTAAGEGGYEAPDLDADDALQFAAEAAPGLLAPFLTAEGKDDVPARDGDGISPSRVAEGR